MMDVPHLSCLADDGGPHPFSLSDEEMMDRSNRHLDRNGGVLLIDPLIGQDQDRVPRIYCGSRIFAKPIDGPLQAGGSIADGK